MNLLKTYKKIMGEESYADLGELLRGFDSFEEFPIISRDSRMKKLKKTLKEENISDFLLGFAFFLLNTLHALARNNQKKVELTAITFTQFDDRHGSILVPKIFVYPSEASDILRQRLIGSQPKEDSNEMNRVKKIFTSCGLVEGFIFLESRFFDKACNEELIRVYAIPRHRQ
ncbi:immunity 15 family protein [Pseudomonas sichuanensis]|uniref:Imm15 family immunity protein n=1 Tax=Pseudomonas sichuanensis TaxID=2213015 RepID=UPI00215E6521|nr:Imm15 family immunity protein [Pseudomonas sichuanensis]UVK84393.1 immunity 15 family protein [Pseudomonas sichuanensis]